MPASIVKTVPVLLPNGIHIQVEASAPAHTESDVAYTDVAEILRLENIEGAIEGIAEVVAKAMEKVAPSKASVEFAIELSLESGKLTALWVKGSGKANLKIGMEWQRHDHANQRTDTPS